MRKMAILLGGLALVLPAIAVAQSVEAGIKAWQAADFQGAVDIWWPLAESGNPDAQFNLGQAYRLGRGVPLNLGAAQTWLGRAAAQGHVDAQTTLGLLLFDSGNQETGLKWLKSAADKGEPRALLIYGTALFNGDGVKRDPVLAYAYVSRAAAQGLAPAKTTLAEMDKTIPLARRKQGVRLALQKAAGSKPAATSSKAPPKAAPVTAVPATGSWRVQLGAFSKRSTAEALFGRLSGSGPLAGRRAFYVPVGAITRLQVGPFANRTAAAAACASLSARGQACFPVAAK